MNNKEIRKIAKEKMQGKMGKAIGITLLYGLITFGISFILGLIPVFGQLASSIISVPFVFGWTKQIISLANGEGVGLVDFFKHGIDNFGRVWGANLRIVLKCLIPFILVIVGAVLPITGNNIMAIAGAVASIAAMIWFIIVLYKYSMINYTIAYDTQGLPSKELIEKTRIESEGKIWKFVCMGIYYGLKIFLVYFVMVFGISLLIKSLNFSFASFGIVLLLYAVMFILIAAAALVYSIQNIAACNEYYKINVLGEDNSNISSDNNVIF